MRKALNFDLDTKKYIIYTGKNATTAYKQIRKFMDENNFKHRQWSGYVSKKSTTDLKVFATVQRMSTELIWLRKCTRRLDVTDIGKQFSLIDAIETAPIKNNETR